MRSPASRHPPPGRAGVMNGQVHIGTSGWSFRDWKGVFYPKDLPDKERFAYYTRFFDCAEINSTYYAIPKPKVFETLAESAPEGFQFLVKLHKETTHAGDNPLAAVQALHEVTTPLREAGKFAGYLGQFPYAFKNDEGSRRLLAGLRSELPEVPVFIEFRHASWLKQPVFEYLATHDLGYVCVDEPSLKGLLPPQTITTTGTGYIRLHGRNAGTWWHSDKGDRYDYSYSEDELQEWVTRIQEMQKRVSKLYIFFNNCHHGQAPLNARQMQAFFS